MTPAERAKRAKAIRDTVEQPTQWGEEVSGVSMAADPQTVGTQARLPKPGDVDWFLTAADRARTAKAQRMTVEAPTIWGAQDGGPDASPASVVAAAVPSRAAAKHEGVAA